MRSRTAHNGRDSVLIKCINCLHTASSAQDFSTMLLRNPSRVATNTPSRHSGVPNNPSHRLLSQRAPFITPTIRWASTRSLRTLAISSLTSTMLGFPYPPPIFFTRYDHNATTSHRRTRQSFLLTAPTARFIHGPFIPDSAQQPTSKRLASTAGPILTDQSTSLRLASAECPIIADFTNQPTSLRLASTQAQAHYRRLHRPTLRYASPQPRPRHIIADFVQQSHSLCLASAAGSDPTHSTQNTTSTTRQFRRQTLIVPPYALATFISRRRLPQRDLLILA